MTELPGGEDTRDRSLVGRGALPKAQVTLGAGMGFAIAIAVLWAYVLATTVLLTPATTILPEAFWWVVFCGVVGACVLATPIALRLWESGVEGLKQSGTGRVWALRDRVPTPTAAVTGLEEKDAERQLLEAVDRHREITPTRAALETSLTVAEADRMLSDLAKGGYLEVRVEGGKLLYGL